MAAGLGFKDFTTGEVLTAADVDGYLMQGVWVFASAAARDAAVTSPQEGNFAYLKDTNVTTYYTGSAWANLDTTGMTNPMTTTGDMIYSSSGSTPARLGIGTANQQLRVNAGATAPEWFTPATPSSGSFTKITSGSFTGVTGVNIDNIFSSTYKNYFVLVYDFGSSGNAGNTFSLQYRYSGTTDTSSLYYGSNYNIERTNATQTAGYQATSSANLMPDIGGGGSYIGIYFSKVGNASESPKFYANYFSSANQDVGMSAGSLEASQTYTGIRLSCATNIAGSYTVYGLEN